MLCYNQAKDTKEKEVVITSTQDFNEYDSICLSFNYSNEFVKPEIVNSNKVDTTSNIQTETLALTVVKPNKIATVKHAIKLTSRISFKSIVASFILTIVNFFI